VIRDYFGVYRYSGRAVSLVWDTSRRLTLALIGLSIAGGLLPAAVAWVGKLIVDSVVSALRTGSRDATHQALTWVGVEMLLVVAVAGIQRALGVVRSLLRALLGNRVNVLILEKALTLELSHFEDSEFYDRMTQARREASSRPLSLVMRTFGLVQDGISLVSYGGLLLAFSGWALLGLVIAAIPAFIARCQLS